MKRFAALFALTGCTGLAPGFDGGVLPVESFFPVTPPAAPAPAAAPALTPCPQGWRQTDDAVPQCSPWPGTGMADCPADQAHFPGTPGCALVGTACGSDEWASGLPATGVLYVKLGAAAPGSGTQSDPFPSLASALAAAGNGDVVALGKGTFKTTSRLGAGITVWGACVAQTRVQLDTTSGLMGAIESTSSGVLVKNLRITAPGAGVATGLASADVTLQDVVVDQAAGQGVSAQRGAHLTLRSVVIRDTKPTATGTYGLAMEADTGGQLTGQNVVISGANLFGVEVSGAMTTVTLQDFAIAHVRGQVSDNSFGYGASASSSAALSFTRGIIDDAQGNGLLCDTSACSLTDVVVNGTLPSAKDPTIGAGLRIVNGTFDATRLVVRGNAGFGVLLGSKAVTLTDAVVSGSTALAGGTSGIVLLDGAALTATRLALDSNATFGMLVSGMSTLDASDLTVSATSGASAEGLAVIEGSTVTLSRAAFSRNEALSILAGGAGVSLTAADFLVTDEPVIDGNEEGGGVVALDHAAVTLTRVTIDGVMTSGLYADAAASIAAQDVAVTGMRLDGKNHLLGSGVVVGDSASLQADRLFVSASQTVGIEVYSMATATLHDVSVIDTALPDCHAPAPCNGEQNVGLLLESGATATVSSFLLLNNGGFGVLLDHAAADLSDGEISGHQIGADVNDPSFDVARLGVRVDYKNNVRNLDAQVVPLPMTPPPPAM